MSRRPDWARRDLRPAIAIAAAAIAGAITLAVMLAGIFLAAGGML